VLTDIFGGHKFRFSYQTRNYIPIEVLQNINFLSALQPEANVHNLLYLSAKEMAVLIISLP